MNKYAWIILLVALMAVGAAFADLSDGLLASFEFSGSASDTSGNNHAGVVHGATLTTDRFGNADSAYSFDGSDNYIDAGQISLPDYASVSIWIQTTSGEFNYSMFDWNTPDNQGGIGLGIGIGGASSGVPDGAFRDDAWTEGSYPRYRAESSIADGDWHHIAVVYDGDALLYVDGILEDTVERSSTLTDSSQSFYIGHLVNQEVGSIYHFTGSIDDVRVYNRALSSTEVTALQAVPEPATMTLIGIGAGLGLFIRRRFLV